MTIWIKDNKVAFNCREYTIPKGEWVNVGIGLNGEVYIKGKLHKGKSILKKD